MKKYEILEHRADLKIRVFGKTKEELFLNAVLAIKDGLRPKIQSTKSKIRNIKTESSNLETLLVDFLSEVLYLIQVNKEVYNKVRFKKFSDTEIKAELSGQKIERFGEDIKAATYHNLDVHQEKNGKWQATILFDI
ncbi:MAG: archease [Candidatus Nealsonbacteria bacterium]|nr:archease [Candidatus Nealsonbacteria bacterium]